jgi:hypothetical protein
MTMLRRMHLRAVAVGAALALSAAVAPVAVAGQPGVSAGNECRETPNALFTPGHSIEAGGAPFNPEGKAGEHYAGNPETESLEHAGSEHAVSQYDIACVQVSK